MDRLKKKRTPIRAQFTKILNDIGGELANEEKDEGVVKTKYKLLENAWNKLEALDDEVKEAMLDEDCTEEQYMNEHDACQGYQESWVQIGVQLEERKPKSRSPNPSESERGSAFDPLTMKRNFKLPKIELKKFNGDLKEWLGYWSQFRKIDEDETLHATNKFQYLIQSLEPGTEALDLVNSYPQTGENYPKAVEALKERFERESLLVQVYVRELLKLVITNVTKKENISLTRMYIKLESHLRALSSLNLATADPSTWLFPLVESSLPDEVLRAWQRSTLSKKDGTQEIPPKSCLDFLIDFIKAEVQSEQQIELAKTGFEDMTVKDKTKKNSSYVKEVKKGKESSTPTAAGLFAGNSSLCIFCDKSHDSKECGRALEMTLDAKNEKIKEKNACYLCLKIGHGSKKCKSFVKCILCKKRHVTIMCPLVHQKSEAKSESSVLTTQTNLSCTSEVMLQTLNVLLVNNNRQKSVRALLDPGAQRSYILKGTAEQLELSAKGKVKLCQQLFGESREVKQHNKYELVIKSEFGDESERIEVLDQKKMCGAIPRMKKGPWVKELKENKIFVHDVGHGTPDIELLIGSDYYGHILTGNKHSLQNGLVALETKFGWTVSGKVTTESDVAMAVTSMHVQHSEIQNLWDLEIIGIRDPGEHQSKQEKKEQTKAHFLQTVTRSDDGRYCVKLPWINGKPEIPNNRATAESRLMTATRKLEAQGQLKTYSDIFDSWLVEGIIEVCDPSINSSCHYLPHRPVLKPNSLTTPVRPVFDASCKSKRTPSLNDCLEKGPNLMETIPSILLRFRENQIGVTSDIRKAFQMIDVDENDRDFQRFLWWDDVEKKTVRIFRHKRVVFGVNCSPYLLAAVLEHHLSNVQEMDKVTAEKLLNSLYVDNCVTSVNSFSEYELFRDQSTRILAECKMELRQWECGMPKGIATRGNVEGEVSAISSVLGLTWHKENDTLGCDLSFAEISSPITKRKVLSVAHQIFDPIGFASPALVKTKLILQEAWATEVGWDEELEENMSQKFLTWYNEIPFLQQLTIPRCIRPPGNQVHAIHTFCDASKDAYAAVVFLRSTWNQDTKITFLQGKSRIAPLKRTKDKNGVYVERRLSIPRLELLACTIGARLTYSTMTALKWEDIPCFYWSDSTTAVAWIHRNDDWGTFVGNRVREVVKLTNTKNWRHIPGIYNPADLPSRGCSPKQLLQSRWWEGPPWLLQTPEKWPRSEEIVDEDEVNSEKKKTTRTLVVTNQNNWFEPKFSGFLKNVRVMGWIRRFVRNARVSKPERELKEFLTFTELRKAEKDLIQCIQMECFSNGLDHFKGMKVKKGEDNMWRISSKLTYKTDSLEFRSPLILPRDHRLVRQLVHHIHVVNCHAGTQFVLGRLREKYWILQGRKAVGDVIHKCVTCKRYASQNISVEPAPLPQNRVEIEEAYQTTGVDLAGPLFMENGEKCWIVLFTCGVYRAVHLDLVTSLSTQAFIGALERFINRNGRPKTVYSDNGTNFEGTANLFKKLDKEKILKESRVRLIQWIFNPPSAPWWGGWWERLVRSVKGLLRRMLGRAKLSYDELRTCLSAVEATINNRPLTTITEDTDDLIPLTPSMFTRGIMDNEFPESGHITSKELQLRYKRIQSLKCDLQARFRKEYLSLLVQKSHERKSKPPQVGDVVMVGADNKKRFDWPIGRILELFPGKDGTVRVATVKTATGILKRPLQRLYPLEITGANEIPISPKVKKSVAIKKPKQTTIPKEDIPEPEIWTKSGRKIVRPHRYGKWQHE